MGPRTGVTVVEMRKKLASIRLANLLDMGVLKREIHGKPVLFVFTTLIKTTLGNLVFLILKNTSQFISK